METFSPTAQKLASSIVVMNWQECHAAAERLWQRQKMQKIPPTSLYGIPRGGSMAALLVQRVAAEDGFILPLVDRPIYDSLVIDDLVDSGATLGRYESYRLDALFRKSVSPDSVAPHATLVEGWVQFPWERNEDTGAEDLVIRLLQFIGEDPSRDGLKDTPKRVLKAWKDLTAGYQQDPKEILSRSFEQPHDELVILRGIEFHSTCEHHLLPFYGTASVGYIPTTKVVGISKLARLVDCFARRLQIQERLTQQIAQAITEVLNPLGVGVVIKAKHSCMGCRGVMKPDSDMVTSVTRGVLRDDSRARAEFISLVTL